MGYNFTFGNINVSSKKHSLRLNIIDNPVLRDKSNAVAPYEFVPIVLTDEYYEDSQLDAIEDFLRSTGLYKYKILSALNCKISKDQIKSEQKSGVIEFYENNCSKYEEYIPKYAPIITSGAALYALLKEDDIYPNHVQQCIFGKTNFWFSPDLTNEHCHAVYPIESFRDIFARGFKKPVDSYKTKLAAIQCSAVVKNGGKLPPRYPKLKKHFITSKEEFNTVFYEPNKHRKGEHVAWDLETSGFDFLNDEIGCITLSFDGVEGYYIPWRYVDKVKLNEILGNNLQIGANLKFDVKFLWSERPTNIDVEGYIIVEDSGIQYKIMNNQDVETSRGIIKGEDLKEDDTILNFSTFEKVGSN